MTDLNIRPVTRDDLPLLKTWISKPHLQEWWADVDTEIAYLVDMIEGRDKTQPFIFEIGGKPAGYIQYWVVADEIAGGWDKDQPWLHDLPADAVGLDLAIGETSQLSKGLGTLVLETLIGQLEDQGRETIVIGPNIANLRAIKAYEKVGFRTISAFDGRTGNKLLMQYVPKSLILNDFIEGKQIPLR